MRYSLTTSVEPVVEPVTLAEARLHLKIDDDITVEDALVLGWIRTARDLVENYCRRSLVSRTLVLRLDCFYDEIRLPRGPVQSVSSVKYVDGNGTEQTVSGSLYQADVYSTPARIRLVSGAAWPTPKMGHMNAVLVTYLAGYATVNAIPKAARDAMKLILTHLERNRGDESAEMPPAVKHLLAPYEIRDFTLE